MTIQQYLLNLRRQLIQTRRSGFDPNPLKVPQTLYVSKLSEIREEPFLAFRRGLIEDRVLIIKVITSANIPLLQEGVVLCNLKGEAAAIDLTEVSPMTPEKRKTDTFLLDLKALFLDEHSLKVVENVGDLIQLGERVHAPVKDEFYVDLQTWHQHMTTEYWPSIRYIFPSYVDSLTAPFKLGEGKWGWQWELKMKDGKLGHEQQRLLYALNSSLVEMTLDGIIERTFAEPAELQPESHLGFQMKEILSEELLACNETDTDKSMDTTDATDKAVRKKVNFPTHNGARIARSLAFGLISSAKKVKINDNPGHLLLPIRNHAPDVVTWEESLPLIDVVKTMEHQSMDYPPQGSAKKSILKPFKKQNIRYNIHHYNPDPDESDRGHIRFPNLVTVIQKGASRTMSPPPRTGDDEGKWAEAERRSNGEQFRGPPFPGAEPLKNRSFYRDKKWELLLPDDNIEYFKADQEMKAKSLADVEGNNVASSHSKKRDRDENSEDRPPQSARRSNQASKGQTYKRKKGQGYNKYWRKKR